MKYDEIKKTLQKQIDNNEKAYWTYIEENKEFEQFHFGEVTTDLTSPEKVVNMYAYIVGWQVVYDVTELDQWITTKPAD